MEEWRVIAECPAYEVSNKGRIRRGERILRLQSNRGGYLHVSLCYKGVKTTRDVHRLVAEAFIDNPDGLKEIDHINRDKSDNSIDNLRWCSRSENNMNREYKPGNTGLSHIWKSGESFRVCIKNELIKVSKNFDNLEAAIAYRDEVMEWTA